jgi:hypothetical protein
MFSGKGVTQMLVVRDFLFRGDEAHLIKMFSFS